MTQATTMPYEQPLYYSHSGKAPVSAVVFTMGSGLIGAVVLAAVYAYLILYIPLAGYISFLLTFGFGWALGWVVAKSVRWGNVRNRAVATAISAIVGLAALYVAWAVWLYALLQREGVDVTAMEVIFSPLGMWELILAINESGAWSISGATPTGIVLWLIWLIEAVIIVGAAVYFGRAAVNDPFCETCNLWSKYSAGVLVTGMGDTAALKSSLERHDFSPVAQPGPAKNTNRFLSYDVHRCTECGQFNVLTVCGCEVSTDKDGNLQVKKVPLIKELLVSPEEVAYLGDVATQFEAAEQQALSTPPPEEAAAAMPSATAGAAPDETRLA
jgi:hypothetical protein